MYQYLSVIQLTYYYYYYYYYMVCDSYSVTGNNVTPNNLRKRLMQTSCSNIDCICWQFLFGHLRL